MVSCVLSIVAFVVLMSVLIRSDETPRVVQLFSAIVCLIIIAYWLLSLAV